jgi:periplasmic divalent cation tolerance protein
MVDHLVVLVTASSQEEAKALALHLLEQQLIACANLIPVQSYFTWEGKFDEAAEVLMILKTTSAVFQEKLIAAIREKHSYQVPEIIGMPIVLGSADYLKWITDSVEG